jgi:large subunit ribosomal protein L1
MGQKKIKIIGDQEQKTKGKKAHLKSGKAEEARLADMGQAALADFEKIQAKEKELEKAVVAQVKTKKAKPARQRSHRYQLLKKNFDVNKKYNPGEALDLITKNATAAFDESVEVHLVTREDKMNGSLTLPHSTGKQQKVAIATDDVIAKIQKGKIDFDILVASPVMMPKLARLARILGPKGLMPNPKNGTIGPRPEELKKKLEGGLVHFKTEPKAPLIHFSIGKVSLGKDKLLENFKAFIKAVNPNKVLKATLASTMGPGVKTQI